MESEAEIVRAVLQELDAIYDGNASRTFTGDYRLEDWGRKEFTHGTWVEGPQIDPSTLTEINTPLEDKVYFAGEAHDVTQQLGLPGAILSGLDVVDRLLSNGMSPA
jgi:monoamine oxidase